MSGDERPPAPARFSLRRHRLHSKDFGRIYSKGSRARGGMMTVVVMENGLAQRRMGLSVGKRCHKLAVRRNRVRRIFREAFRLSQSELPQGIDVILIASAPGISPGLEKARRELELLVRKALLRYRERVAKAADAHPDRAHRDANEREPTSRGESADPGVGQGRR